jgi:hypothetical protein
MGCLRTIVPKDKFVQINRELRPTDTVRGSDKPLLEVPDRTVSQGHDGFGAFAKINAHRLNARPMLESGFLQSGEAFQAIGIYGRTWCHVVFKEIQQSRALEIRNYRHPSASGCAAAFLHCNQHGGRFPTLQLSAPAQAGLLTADPRIINLHLAVQWFTRQVDQRPPELMEHHPGRLIATQGKLALQEQGGEAPLVRSHQVSGPEPNRQGDLRVMQNRSGRQRNLVPTTNALPTPPLHQLVCLPLSASRTNEVIGPADRACVCGSSVEYVSEQF